MNAQLKKIQVTPTKFDDNGEAVKDEFATLTFEAPMDAEAQRSTIVDLLSASDRQWLTLSVEAKQIPIDFGRKGVIDTG